MKIFVVFGSTSDHETYEPLKKDLAAVGEVEFDVISAHRNLEELQTRLKTLNSDVIIAGAGLAAALPGVCASIVDKPVFGVSVAAHFGGLDALASIAQMPFGMPVLTSGSGQEKSIADFLALYNEKGDIAKLHFVLSDWVCDSDFAKKELDRAQKVAEEHGWSTTTGNAIDEDAFNIVYVTQDDDIQTDALAVHVPLFSTEDIKKPENYMVIYNWAQRGGLWVGANNSRNAVLAANRLFKNKESDHGTAGHTISRVG